MTFTITGIPVEWPVVLAFLTGYVIASLWFLLQKDNIRVDAEKRAMESFKDGLKWANAVHQEFPTEAEAETAHWGPAWRHAANVIAGKNTHALYGYIIQD